MNHIIQIYTKLKLSPQKIVMFSHEISLGIQLYISILLFYFLFIN